MINIKKLSIYAVMLALVLSVGCNSKNEASNKPLESNIVVNEITEADNIAQTNSAENEPSEDEIEEVETTPVQSAENTETDTQTDEPSPTDTSPSVTEENINTEDEEPDQTDNVVDTTPEEDYNYIIADTNEEDIVEAIAPTTDNITSETSADVLSADNKYYSWWYRPQKDHTRPSAEKGIDFFAKFDTYYLGEDSNKIYLTFDEGYENGYTPKILDTLKENNVTAAFFVTKPFVTSQPQLVKRMVDEGHLVCNHSVTHPDLTTKTNDEIIQEIKGVEDAVYEVAGVKTAKFFRPPAGVYSERVLSVLKSQGYKTIFWSFAHRDWELDNQPPVETTIKRVMDNHHNGMIMLIHAVSQSNTDALDTIIKNLKDFGYEFDSLENL